MAKTKLLKNKKMNTATFELRKEVMNLIYEVKSVYDIPRIDVRIGESKNCNTLGIARLNKNIIPWHLPEVNCGSDDRFISKIIPQFT